MICALSRADAAALAQRGTLALQSALDLAAYENRYLFSQVFGVVLEEEDRLTGNKNGAAAAGTHPLPAGSAGWFYEEGFAWAATPAAAEEAAGFLKRSGWEALWCEEDIARLLRPILDGCSTRPAVSLTASGVKGKREEKVFSPRPEEVYRLLWAGGAWEKAPRFDGWYSDCSHRARRGMRRLYGIRENGVLASTATADVLGTGVLLRDVATHPEFRGRGLCSRLLRHLFAQYPGSRFHLLTESQSARRVYERAGFVIEKDNLVRIHKEKEPCSRNFLKLPPP